jgi:hypothetical protein
MAHVDRSFRSATAQVALESEADYVLFLDDDVLFPFDSLDGLPACNSDIASADVCIRGYPFDHMCFKYGKGAEKDGLYTVTKIQEPRGIVSHC